MRENLFLAGLVICMLTFTGFHASAENPPKAEQMINPYLDYTAFPPGADPDEYLGKNVTITGRTSTVIWQHMFRGPGDKPYIQECYIDADEIYGYLPQLVGYNIGTVPFDWSIYENEHLRFYGSFGIVKGSSKRPGSKADETYSELYFDIVDIEVLQN
jgi:hypothetical protein